MSTLVVHPAGRGLEGSVPVPSDKSIGHRALIFAALADGTSRIAGFSHGEDNVSTATCFRALGVGIEDVSRTELKVTGAGLFGLRAPDRDLDCGNSGTTMRLLSGILCAQQFASRLVGDASLSGRPMMRIVGPLRARGGHLDGKPHPKKAGDVTAPLDIRALVNGEFLTELELDSQVASAQVKSAVLLSGLYAHGATFFREPTLSRDHTERMMLAMGVPLQTRGPVVSLDPSGWDGKLAPLDIEVPGDVSAAAFLLVAAQIVPGSKVSIRDVGVNPTRTGLLEIARDMGAGLRVEPQGDRAGEPLANLHGWHEPLRSGRIGGELVPRAIDEIPIACVLAARAAGATVITDAEELRVKESDRLATMAGVLRAFGVECEETPDGMRIVGSDRPLTPADVESRGDHRIAMSAAVLALAASGPSTIRDADCIATSFPRFVGTLRALGARVDVE